MSGAIVLDGNSALSAEALSNQLGNSYNFATDMIAQGFKLKASEVSGRGQGPYRDGNTVMALEHSLLIINNKQFI